MMNLSPNDIERSFQAFRSEHIIPTSLQALPARAYGKGFSEAHQSIFESTSLWDVEQKKNCIGLPLFAYFLTVSIDKSFASDLQTFGSLAFPLGGEYPMIKIDVPSLFMMTGLVGTKELKLTLRHSSPSDARERFEEALRNYVLRKQEADNVLKIQKPLTVV